MTRSLSTRTENIAASLTVAIDTLAKQMIADGKDVVSLGAGEPDFPTPTPIQDAACKAIREGKTRYTAPVGILDVRKAVCEKLREENGLGFTPEQIVMTSGAKHAVFNALAAFLICILPPKRRFFKAKYVFCKNGCRKRHPDR